MYEENLCYDHRAMLPFNSVLLWRSAWQCGDAAS
jgi:hypothetical protein